jgi:hypothetical protein
MKGLRTRIKQMLRIKTDQISFNPSHLCDPCSLNKPKGARMERMLLIKTDLIRKNP